MWMWVEVEMHGEQQRLGVWGLLRDREGKFRELTEPAANFVTQGAFRQIHRVGYGKDNQPTVPKPGPVEEVVHDGLVLGDQLIQFVH